MLGGGTKITHLLPRTRCAFVLNGRRTDNITQITYPRANDRWRTSLSYTAALLQITPPLPFTLVSWLAGRRNRARCPGVLLLNNIRVSVCYRAHSGLFVYMQYYDNHNHKLTHRVHFDCVCDRRHRKPRQQRNPYADLCPPISIAGFALNYD